MLDLGEEEVVGGAKRPGRPCWGGRAGEVVLGRLWWAGEAALAVPRGRGGRRNAALGGRAGDLRSGGAWNR